MRLPARSSRSNYMLRKKKYSMGFNLFNLAQKDSMRSVVYVKGSNVQKIFRQLVLKVCDKKQASRKKLSRELAEKYNCDPTTIQHFFYTKDYFPLYLVNDIIMLAGDNTATHKKEFQDSIKYFKFGVSKNWVRFPKKLTSKLAWLCGGIAADGHISRERDGKERVSIIDGNRKTIFRAAEHLKQIFDYSPRVNKCKDKNAWLLIVDSKAIVKFFTTFLGFCYGNKIFTVSEPAIIEDSQFRLDWASGVVCFDGSVELDSTVSLGARSFNMVNSVGQILLNNGFDVKQSFRSGNYFIRTGALLQNKQADKWIAFLGNDLEKAERLRGLVHGFHQNVRSEKEALLAMSKFVNYPRRNECPLGKIFSIIKSKKTIKKQELLKLSEVAHATLYKYTWLLRKANIVSCDNGFFGRGHENTYVFNPNVLEWRVPMVC